jgi:hypothetical protein
MAQCKVAMGGLGFVPTIHRAALVIGRSESPSRVSVAALASRLIALDVSTALDLQLL